ncbi:hypothetical protein PINS_up002808 [Pythium insidiosum]|nr:hypothetical protein PINS_up002808 [Pythium insidiosum]
MEEISPLQFSGSCDHRQLCSAVDYNTCDSKTAADMDIVDRKSFASSTLPLRNDSQCDEYKQAKSPDLEGGALRPGGAPNVWSRECFGLLAQYGAIGLVYGTLPGTIYPFLAVYLNMEGTQTASARVLLSLPWSFKFLFGVLTDCFPIMGYRRRPYMLLGWTVCLTCLLAMACMKPGPPFWGKKHFADKYAGLSDEVLDVMNTNGTESSTIANFSARDQGGKFILLMMLAAFGYIQAAVASGRCRVSICAA